MGPSPSVTWRFRRETYARPLIYTRSWTPPRVRDSLPNGYCGRPAQQDCPHPNACLTCPDFQTTPVFLQIHRRQAATNSRLIAQADAKGQLRLAENLRRVQANLDQIIPALEALQDDGHDNDPR